MRCSLPLDIKLNYLVQNNDPGVTVVSNIWDDIEVRWGIGSTEVLWRAPVMSIIEGGDNSEVVGRGTIDYMRWRQDNKSVVEVELMEARSGSRLLRYFNVMTCEVESTCTRLFLYEKFREQTSTDSEDVSPFCNVREHFAENAWTSSTPPVPPEVASIVPKASSIPFVAMIEPSQATQGGNVTSLLDGLCSLHKA